MPINMPSPLPHQYPSSTTVIMGNIYSNLQYFSLHYINYWYFQCDLRRGHTYIASTEYNSVWHNMCGNIHIVDNIQSVQAAHLYCVVQLHRVTVGYTTLQMSRVNVVMRGSSLGRNYSSLLSSKLRGMPGGMVGWHCFF